MFQIIQNLDSMILSFINDYCHNSILDRAMPIITYLGSMGSVWILISVVLLLSKRHRKAGILVMASLLIATILGEGIMKHLVQRPRPFVNMPVIKMLIDKPASYSFPSGHTTASFAAAGILMREFKKYRIYFISLASLIAFSRMYLYVHYPTDIIGGILLGLFCSWVVWTFGKKFVSFRYSCRLDNEKRGKHRWENI